MVRVNSVSILNKIMWALDRVTFIKMVLRATGVVCASLGRSSAAGSPIALSTDVIRIGSEIGLPWVGGVVRAV
uniref:Secreted protein n=1 Tax=Romanomermis culicivorax TaxID=13658 RepID=A0A915HMC7_ROMCU